jgi:hypothetical protein
MSPGPLPEGGSRQEMTRDAWLRSVAGDIDPAKHAGEGWFATEEYARPEDIGNPYTRGEVTHEGSYYPGPDSGRAFRRY